MSKEINVPDIGDFDEVDVIEVLVAPGDTIAKEDPLITLESDKASMEIPSPAAGVVKDVKVKVGDKVSEGSLILLLETGEEQAPADKKTAKSSADEKPKETSVPESAAAQEPKTGGAQEVKVPDIGDFNEVDVIEVLVAPGDKIAEEDPLITLESDKASMEIPSPAAGVIKDVKIKVGDKVSEGSLILLLEGAGGGERPAREETKAEQTPAAQAPKSAGSVSAAERREPPVAHEKIDEKAFASVHASPSIRRFARELGVDLGRVQGSGRKGRITKEDVQDFVKQAMAGPAAAPAPTATASGMGIPPIPEVDFSQFGEIEEKPLERIQKISGPHLHRAWLNVPMVTHHDEADITELEDFRQSLKAESEKSGVRVTALAFLMKALANTLKAFPTLNSSLSPDSANLILKKYYHIGIAVDTPNGLVVPVFRDVDKKSIFELSADLGTTSKKARDGKLGPKDMQGGCMSISSLGGIGGTAFTPIVNAPEVAILGVTRSQMKPVWNGKEFIPRLMMPLDLSYDHRVIDGALAARFMVQLCQNLSDLRRLLL